MTADQALVSTIRAGLREAGDRDVAAGQAGLHEVGDTLLRRLRAATQAGVAAGHRPAVTPLVRAWALREFSRTNPVRVRAEVDLLGDRLSGLSRREAVRRLG